VGGINVDLKSQTLLIKGDDIEYLVPTTKWTVSERSSSTGTIMKWAAHDGNNVVAQGCQLVNKCDNPVAKHAEIFCTIS
jgi:hypothetical protein